MQRRWFQIHLSTALVLMFVAGVFLWGNSVPRHYPAGSGEDAFDAYGWPWEAFYFFTNGYETWWNIRSLLCNTAMALAAFVVSALLCELPIRRNERKREP